MPKQTKKERLMTAYVQSEQDIQNFIQHPNTMPVAKLPIVEMVTKCIPGQNYFCTDTGVSSPAKDGECLITRFYEDGSKDTYKN